MPKKGILLIEAIIIKKFMWAGGQVGKFSSISPMLISEGYRKLFEAPLLFP